MDAHNQHAIYTNEGYINAQSANRVYINPNFHRTNIALSQNASVCLHQQTNFQTPRVSRSKIYVNPNFVRTSAPTSVRTDNVNRNTAVNNYYGVPNVTSDNPRTNIAVMTTYCASTTLAANICYVNSSHSTMTSATTMRSFPKMTPNIFPQSTKHHVADRVTKSRYSLVRQNKDPVNVTATLINKTVTKMKISKYKTVSVDHTKNVQTENDKLRLVILPKTNSQVVLEKAKRIIKSQFIQSRFKLVKKNMGTIATKPDVRTPIKRKYTFNSFKILSSSNPKLKTTVELSKFKKNNIPCPLYRKYGTCLRKSRGKCEFLHDRKHVSICRKFLKGICHDKACLLSHDASAEKMPTCHFYLKGLCTKEDCPYLHIKLNEKANICLDFLKGYCEKGDKCLNRHVNVCPDQAIKGVCFRKPCLYSHRSKKNVVNKVKTRVTNQSMKSKINSKAVKEFDNRDKHLNQNSNVEEANGQDCRYYREVVNEASSLEVIKPSRCKLGALPSFIQL